MTVTELLLQNPSAFHALRISVQTRKQATPTAEGAATPRRAHDAQMTPADRARLEELGSALIKVTQRRVDAYGAARQHDALMPVWQNDGAADLPSWITQTWADEGKPAGAPKPKGVKVLDEWSDARPFAAIEARGTMRVSLDDHRRLVLESDDADTVLSFSNSSPIHTLKLHTLDNGRKTVSATFVAPSQFATLVLGKHGGIIEQRGL